jgi:hypothetical protein
VKRSTLNRRRRGKTYRSTCRLWFYHYRPTDGELGSDFEAGSIFMYLFSIAPDSKHYQRAMYLLPNGKLGMQIAPTLKVGQALFWLL